MNNTNNTHSYRLTTTVPAVLREGDDLGVTRGSNLVMGDGGTEESSSSVVRWVVLEVLPPLRVLRTDCFRRCGRCLRTSVPFLVSMDIMRVS